MAYATESELAEYLGVNISDLPDDVDNMLDKASEVIDYITLDQIDTEDEAHLKAAKMATMAQYEYWADLGTDTTDVLQQVDSISIGSFSISGSGENSFKTVAERARYYLFLEGLLNTGVEMT